MYVNQQQHQHASAKQPTTTKKQQQATSSLQHFRKKTASIAGFSVLHPTLHTLCGHSLR